MQRLRRFVRGIRMRLEGGAVVLAYHRVTDLAHDPYGLAVSPAHFGMHIDHLKSTCTVMHLRELGESLQKRKLPRRAVAITFDDGYIDVFEQAYPILKSARIPATVFIPSGLIDGRREFWWDELERIFYTHETFPGHLSLHIKGQSYDWDTALPENRKNVFWAIHQLLMPLHHEDRTQVLDELMKWSGTEVNGRPGYRTMNAQEMARLLQDGYIEIGAHTITHAALSGLPEAEQRREIIEGREILAGLIQRRVRSFAYPYGDFTEKTVEILRDADFALACTMHSGRIAPGDDIFRLKRCETGNWPPDIFARQLESLFDS